MFILARTEFTGINGQFKMGQKEVKKELQFNHIGNFLNEKKMPEEGAERLCEPEAVSSIKERVFSTHNGPDA